MKPLGTLRLEYVKFGKSGDWKIVSEGGTVVAVLNDTPYTQPREWGQAIVDAFNGKAPYTQEYKDGFAHGRDVGISSERIRSSS